MNWYDLGPWASAGLLYGIFLLGEFVGGRQRVCNHRWKPTNQLKYRSGYYIECDRCHEIRKVTD